MNIRRYATQFLKKMTSNNVVNVGWLVTGGFAVLGVYKTRQRFRNAMDVERARENRRRYQYVYSIDPEEFMAPIKKHIARWWPVGYIAKPIAWQLFEQIRSSVSEINDDAIRKFAQLSTLLESECNHFAVCMDLKTAVALARAGADPRLFISPLIISKDNKDYYGNKFRIIFSTLPSQNIHGALNDLVRTALRYYHPTETERDERSLEYYSGFEPDFHLSQNPAKGIKETDFLRICLQGVVSHSRMSDRIPELLNLEILDLLVVISREYREHVEIMSLVLKVLANLSYDASSAQPIKDTGCLKILAEASQSSILKLSLPAKRALHNMDRRSNAPLLPPGMYQLHPEYGCDDCSFHYDIVFIHGLLGGVFRTWRRQDNDPYELNPVEEETSKPEIPTLLDSWKSRMLELRSKAPMGYNPSLEDNNTGEKFKYPVRRMDASGEYSITYEDIPLELENLPSFPTQCWPRDWLPRDCPTARIIAVDFESFVSKWMNICPIETAERRLEDRSAELLKKMAAAGIGQRPILWVTHSMGGLLLKSLLCQADEKPETRAISKNTKGIVFCSVPHFGTHLAANTTRRWLLLPTEEIEDLSNQSSQLSTLHNCFLGLYQKYKFQVLSFAETLDTRTGLGMKFRLVPYASSDIGIGEFYPLKLDHLSTCKPWSRGSFLYVKIVEFLQKVSANALFEQEAKNRAREANLVILEDDPLETEFKPEKNQTPADILNSVGEWISTTVFSFFSNKTNSTPTNPPDASSKSSGDNNANADDTCENSKSDSSRNPNKDIN